MLKTNISLKLTVSHSSKTANIILPGLTIKQRWTSLRLQANWYSNLLNCIMLLYYIIPWTLQ